MKKLILTFILSALIVLPMTGAAYANDMIGSSAQGYVSGDIVQYADGNSTNEIFVGSIINDSNRPIRNIHVQAHVDGDIIVRTNNNAHSRVSIGSYIQRRR